MNNLNFTKALVSSILRDEHRAWTIQGFGFLRTYFGPNSNPKQYRINLWDSRFTIPNVSTIHDHPWDFNSLIIAGLFKNQRYDLIEDADPTHKYAILKTGVGGKLDFDTTKSCHLAPKKIEVYCAGETYSQKADEIHETLFSNGSVTLNERHGDTEHARVFWKYDNNWVDAIPRLATEDEIKAAVEHSLDAWF